MLTPSKIGHIIGYVIGIPLWIIGLAGILEWIITMIAKLFGETEEVRKAKAPKRQKTTRIIMVALLILILAFGTIVRFIQGDYKLNLFYM